MTFLDRLSPGRKITVSAAGEGCWSGTTELLASVVVESRRDGAWKPRRAALLSVDASNDGPFMEHEEFAAWRKTAKAMARAMKRPHPREDLGFAKDRYNDLGNRTRSQARKLAISKIEALACAHYAMGYAMPCAPEDLKAWFTPRFGQLATLAAVLDLEVKSFSARINGYVIEDGAKETVIPEPTFIRALDWVWRNGPVSPYGARIIQFWPDQAALPRSSSTGVPT